MRELAQGRRHRRHGPARPDATTARRIVGRFGARSKARKGEPVEVAVDTRALHFFDPETGLGIYDGTKGARMRAPSLAPRSGCMLALLLLRRGLRRRRRRRGSRSDDGGETTARASPATISVIGVWTGAEQESFQAVIDGFKEENPDVTVKYTSAGDNIVTVLSTAVEGGNPPDIATLPQPGSMRDFVERGRAAAARLRARTRSTRTSASRSSTTGSVDGTLYGLLFKAANKSTVWYNVAVVRGRRRRGAATTATTSSPPPKTINASGVPAYSIGGADGWTLTDLFENIYLRTAGAEKYDQLAKHEIPWTDQSVKDALAEMAKIVGDTDNIAGGEAGALQTDFPTSVANVFSATPKAAMVIEGDFVPGVAGDDRPLEPETGFNVFAVPGDRRLGPAVVGGGDLVVMFKDNPAAQAFVEYLATPEAAEIWAEARRLLVAEQERRHERLPRRDPADDGGRDRRGGDRSASTSPTCSRPRSAAPSARACSSSSRTS